jgi:predicted methyltransferase
LETLQFFGIKDTMTIVEIYPGGGWYQEILAPYLNKMDNISVLPMILILKSKQQKIDIKVRRIDCQPIKIFMEMQKWSLLREMLMTKLLQLI